MNIVKLTPENANMYIGYEIIFKRKNGDHIIRRINGVSPTCKTVYIDYLETNNSLQNVSRNIFVIIT